jgi:hypothetical protein
MTRKYFAPIHCNTDGHFLVHAVSRCLTGLELHLALLTNELKEAHSQTWNNMQPCSVDFLMKLNETETIDECDPE